MIPTVLNLCRVSNTLDIEYSTGEKYQLTAEFLRVHSPSAKDRDYGKKVLIHGKINISIERIEAVGLYAIKIFFEDGHNSGIFTWEYLYTIGKNQAVLWKEYLERIKKTNKFRNPAESIVKTIF